MNKKSLYKQGYDNVNIDDADQPDMFKSKSTINANSLLGFSYQDEDEKPLIRKPQYGQGRKKSGTGYNKLASRNSYFDKESFVQASMKFVMRNPKEDGGCRAQCDQEEIDEIENEGYLKNFFEPNEAVRWRDVVLVRYDMVSSTDVRCPICMDPLSSMTCPRITKCGHIYCWPCILQYLEYDKEKSWKRCPLCFDPVYKFDLKNVIIRKNIYYKEGNVIKFNLQVRSKANCLIKDKFLES